MLCLESWPVEESFNQKTRGVKPVDSEGGYIIRICNMHIRFYIHIIIDIWWYMYIQTCVCLCFFVDDGSHTCFLVLTCLAAPPSRTTQVWQRFMAGILVVLSGVGDWGVFNHFQWGKTGIPFSMASIQMIWKTTSRWRFFQILLRIWCCLSAIWVHSANPHGFGLGGLNCMQGTPTHSRLNQLCWLGDFPK